jgi:transcriptional regulator with XRE-family HTH domain
MDEHNANHAAVIGEKLREAREQRKMSLRELASKAEVSASMLSQIENGKAYPSVRSTYNIAAALGLPVDYFFPDTDASVKGRVAEEMTASDLREAQLNGTLGANALELEKGYAAPAILHGNMRPTISLKGGIEWARLTAHAEPGAEFLEITYAPGATSGDRMSHHIGREFGLVLDGALTVELGFERYTLCQGDSIIFDSTTPHRLTNHGDKPMRALWVVLTSR